jgi:hypothetical protein
VGRKEKKPCNGNNPVGTTIILLIQSLERSRRNYCPVNILVSYLSMILIRNLIFWYIYLTFGDGMMIWKNIRKQLAIASGLFVEGLALFIFSVNATEIASPWDVSLFKGFYDFLAMTGVFNVFLALIPAVIAYRKGRNIFLWYTFGWLFVVIAFIASLIISKNDKAKLEHGGYIRCPYCKELVLKGASVCPHCKSELD